MRYSMLFGFVVIMVLGQVLFKRVALVGADKPIIEMLVTAQMVAALALYAVATVLWVVILRTTPLSVAYPFAAMAIVLVPVVGVIVFGEQMTWRLAIGTAFIVTGVMVVST